MSVTIHASHQDRTSTLVTIALFHEDHDRAIITAVMRQSEEKGRSVVTIAMRYNMFQTGLVASKVMHYNKPLGLS